MAGLQIKEESDDRRRPPEMMHPTSSSIKTEGTLYLDFNRTKAIISNLYA